jgi:serine/threonine protein kinase
VVRRISKYSESAAIEADVLRDVGARAAARPGGADLVVALLAHFAFEGHACLVFESLGRSLYDYLKANDYRPFPYAMVVDFARQLLAAVDFLHKMDLCHTDLKVRESHRL